MIDCLQNETTALGYDLHPKLLPEELTGRRLPILDPERTAGLIY